MPPNELANHPAGDHAGTGLPEAVRVLVVEDNAECAGMGERTLDRAPSCRFEVGHAERLAHRRFSATRLCWSIGIGGLAMTP